MRRLKYLIGCFAIVASFLIITSCEEDVMADVEIGSISSDAVFQGSPVSLTGEGFDQVQFVFVGGIQVEFTLEENTITFNVPDEAPVGMTTITLAMTENRRETFEFEVVQKPTPVITSFDPYVPVGSDLVIKGTSLDNSTTVSIDGISASVVSASDNELVVTVPAGVEENSAIGFEITTTYGTAESPTAFYARESEVANSDLETVGEGDAPFADWELLNAGDGAITAVTGGYGGTRSMRIVPAGGNPWDRQVASTGVPLNFEDQYTIVLWARGESDGAIMRVSVSQYDGAGADYFYGETKELSTNWEQYTWTFTVTNDLPTHRVVLDMGAGTVPFMIDQIGLVPGIIGAAGPAELMPNGDFETDLSGWTALNGSAEVSASEAYCGSQSMTATGAGGNPWDTQIASDPLDLEVGTDYEIGFWAKAAGPDGVFRLSMSQYDGNGSDFYYSPDIDIPEDWTYFSFVVTAEEIPSNEYRLLFDMGATSQTFFVDGVSVKEYVAPPSAYANGGFEDGLTGWTALNGTAEATTDDAYEGSTSMTATGVGGNPWDVQIATDAVALTVGNQVKISFWAKAAGPDGVFRISMSQYDGNGADFFYSRDLDIPEDWTYFSFVTTVQATDSGDHRLLFDMGASTQTFFVDGVVVSEYEACE